jgi:hypothetical protein
MWALVQDGQVTKTFNHAKGFVLNNTQYPKDIFSKWSKSEKEAIGIYEVIVDKTNYKDTSYYNNTNSTIAFANDQVTESWGTATAKNLNDVLVTQQDIDDGLVIDKEVGDVKVEGLKTIHKRIIKNQAAGLLTSTDWYVVKATEVADYTVPSNITTYRAAVRTNSNEMETAIDNTADVNALKRLYEYVNTGTEQDPVYTRPLGEWPEEVI